MTDKLSGTVDALTKALVDQGKLIEAGWLSYRYKVIPRGAGPVQIEESRRCFFAGAQHLFGSIATFLDGGDEPTENDLRRMDQIDAELRAFIDSFKAQVLD